MKWIYLMCLVIVTVSFSVRSQPRQGRKPPGLPPTATRRGQRPANAPPPRVKKNPWIPPPPGSPNNRNTNQWGPGYGPRQNQQWQNSQFGPAPQYNQFVRRNSHLVNGPKNDPTLNNDMYLTIDKHPPVLTRANSIPGGGRKITSSKQRPKPKPKATPPPTDPTAPTTYSTDWIDYTTIITYPASSTEEATTTTTTMRPTTTTTKATTTIRTTTTTKATTPQPTTAAKRKPPPFAKPDSPGIPRPPPLASVSNTVSVSSNTNNGRTTLNNQFGNNAFEPTPWNQEKTQGGSVNQGLNDVNTNNRQVSVDFSAQSGQTISTQSQVQQEKPRESKTWLTGGSTFKSSSNVQRPVMTPNTDTLRPIKSRVAGDATLQDVNKKSVIDISLEYGSQAVDPVKPTKSTSAVGTRETIYTQNQSYDNGQSLNNMKTSRGGGSRYSADVLGGNTFSERKYAEPTATSFNRQAGPIERNNFMSNEQVKPTRSQPEMGVVDEFSRTAHSQSFSGQSNMNNRMQMNGDSMNTMHSTRQQQFSDNGQSQPSLSKQADRTSQGFQTNLYNEPSTNQNSYNRQGANQNTNFEYFEQSKSQVAPQFQSSQQSQMTPDLTIGRDNRAFSSNTNMNNEFRNIEQGSQLRQNPSSSFDIGSASSKTYSVDASNGPSLSMNADTRAFGGIPSINNDRGSQQRSYPSDNTQAMPTSGRSSSFEMSSGTSFDISYERGSNNGAQSSFNNQNTQRNNFGPSNDKSYLTSLQQSDSTFQLSRQNEPTGPSSSNFMAAQSSSVQEQTGRRSSQINDVPDNISSFVKPSSVTFSESSRGHQTAFKPSDTLDTNGYDSSASSTMHADNKPSNLDSASMTELKFRVQLEKLIRKRLTNTLTVADKIQLEKLKGEYQVWKQQQAVQSKAANNYQQDTMQEHISRSQLSRDEVISEPNDIKLQQNMVMTKPTSLPQRQEFIPQSSQSGKTNGFDNGNTRESSVARISLKQLQKQENSNYQQQNTNGDSLRGQTQLEPSFGQDNGQSKDSAKVSPVDKIDNGINIAQLPLPNIIKERYMQGLDKIKQFLTKSQGVQQQATNTETSMFKNTNEGKKSQVLLNNQQGQGGASMQQTKGLNQPQEEQRNNQHLSSYDHEQQQNSKNTMASSIERASYDNSGIITPEQIGYDKAQQTKPDGQSISQQYNQNKNNQYKNNDEQSVNINTVQSDNGVLSLGEHRGSSPNVVAQSYERTSSNDNGHAGGNQWSSNSYGKQNINTNPGSQNVDDLRSTANFESQSFGEHSSLKNYVSQSMGGQNTGNNYDTLAMKAQRDSNNYDSQSMGDQRGGNNFVPQSVDDPRGINNFGPQSLGEQRGGNNFVPQSVDDPRGINNFGPQSGGDQRGSNNFGPQSADEQRGSNIFGPQSAGEQRGGNNFGPQSIDDQRGSNNFGPQPPGEQRGGNNFDNNDAHSAGSTSYGAQVVKRQRALGSQSGSQSDSTNFGKQAYDDQTGSFNYEPQSASNQRSNTGTQSVGSQTVETNFGSHSSSQQWGSNQNTHGPSSQFNIQSGGSENNNMPSFTAKLTNTNTNEQWSTSQAGHINTGPKSFGENSGRSDNGGRNSGLQNFGGQGGQQNYNGQSGQQNYGGQGGQQNFGGQGGQQNYNGQGGQQNYNGQGGQQKYNGQGGQQNNGGQGGQQNFGGQNRNTNTAAWSSNDQNTNTGYQGSSSFTGQRSDKSGSSQSYNGQTNNDANSQAYGGNNGYNNNNNQGGVRSGSYNNVASSYVQTTAAAPSKKKCSITPVCGTDGYTYMSDCFIWPGGAKACDGFCPCTTAKKEVGAASSSVAKLEIPKSIPPLRSSVSRTEPKMKYVSPTDLPMPAGTTPPAPTPHQPVMVPTTASPAPVCNCPKLYRPVCGIKGNTYTNDCIRRCNYEGFNCHGQCPCGTDSAKHQPAGRPDIDNNVKGQVSPEQQTSHAPNLNEIRPDIIGAATAGADKKLSNGILASNQQSSKQQNNLKAPTNDNLQGSLTQESSNLITNKNNQPNSKTFQTTGQNRQIKRPTVLKSLSHNQLERSQVSNTEGNANSQGKSQPLNNSGNSVRNSSRPNNGQNNRGSPEAEVEAVEREVPLDNRRPVFQQGAQTSRDQGQTNQNVKNDYNNPQRSSSVDNSGKLNGPSSVNRNNGYTANNNGSNSAVNQNNDYISDSGQTSAVNRNIGNNANSGPSSVVNQNSDNTVNRWPNSAGNRNYTNTGISGSNLAVSRNDVFTGNNGENSAVNRNNGNNANSGPPSTVSKSNGNTFNRRPSSAIKRNNDNIANRRQFTGVNGNNPANRRKSLAVNHNKGNNANWRESSAQKRSNGYSANSGSNAAVNRNTGYSANSRTNSAVNRNNGNVANRGTSSTVNQDNGGTGNSKVTSTPACYCSEVYAPVCGSDGVTYTNPCRLSCSAGVETSCTGECPCRNYEVQQQQSRCEDFCEIVYKPVCSVTGRTFGNDCLRQCSMETKECNGECPCSHVVKTRLRPEIPVMYNQPTNYAPTSSSSSGGSMDPQNFNIEPSNQPLSTCECRPGDIDPVCTTSGETLWYGCEAICLGIPIACSSECPC